MKPIRNIELQNQAYEYIKNKLLNNEFEEGTIYSASKLAASIGISRTPMRDALQRLVQEGLIDVVPNKGFVLHQLTRQDIFEAYEVRMAIETFCAMKASEEIDQPRTKRWLQELMNCLHLQQKYAQEPQDTDAFAREDLRFHTMIIDYSKNQAFQELFQRYVYQIQRLSIHAFQRPHRIKDTLQEHLRILSAIQSGNALRTHRAVVQHIKAPLSINLTKVEED